MRSFFVLILMSVISTVLCGEITLVENGQARASIVLGRRPSKSAQLGAFELQHHLKLLTGAVLAIEEAPIAGMIPIILGGQEMAGGECSVIDSSSGDAVRLYGKDSPLYERVDYGNPATFPPYQFSYNGTLFAVYDFLEQFCGCRFYGPGEQHTTLQPVDTLAIPPVHRRHVPVMEAFREVYAHLNVKASLTDRRDLALWRLRWRMCSFYGQTNHNMYSPYYYFYKRSVLKYPAQVFRESHPEYFAQGYAGRGTGDSRLVRNFPNDPDIPPQLCYTNQAVIDWFAEEAAIYFKGHNRRGGWNNKDCANQDETLPLLPKMEGKPYFYPLEGADNGGFCQCGNCRRWYEDTSDCSRLKFNFMGQVAKRAAELAPGAGISTLAYIRSLGYPEGVELPSNLSVQLCLTVYSWWHPEARRLQEGAYRQWVSHEGARRPLTLWLYLFGSWWDSSHHFGGYKPFPTFYPWEAGRLMRRFVDDGLRGVFIETQLAYLSLEAYVAIRLAYDRSANPEQIIHEYFQRYYGVAGEAMETFYQVVESAFWRSENCPSKWLGQPGVLVGPYGKKHPFWGTGLLSPDLNWSLGTEERMAKLSALLKQAGAQADSASAKERVRHFEESIWKPALRGREEWQNYPTADDTEISWPFAVEARDFTYEGNATQVEDAGARNGRAGRQDASHGWTMKYYVKHPALLGDRQVSISLRTDVADGEFTIGVFDKFNRKPIVSRRVKAAKYCGERYQTIAFNKVNLRPGCYVFLGGMTPKAENGHYYVDEITINCEEAQ